MNLTTSRIRILVAFSLMSMLACIGAAQEREWVSSNGKFKHTATAVRIEAEQGLVVLKDSAGKELTVSISKLSDRDVDFIRKQFAAKFKTAGSKTPFSLSKIKTLKRRMLFAKDVRNELAKFADHIRPQDQAEFAKQFKEFEELTKVGAVNIGGEFISEADLTARRAKSNVIVQQWYDTARRLNSRSQLESLTEVTKLDPVSIEAAIFLGLHYLFFERDYDTAHKHFKDAVKRGRRFHDISKESDHSNLVAALNNLALLEIRQNDAEQAYRYWNEATDIRGDSAQEADIKVNIAKAGRFLMGNGKYGLFASNATKKRYAQLVAKTDTRNIGREGWLYFMPVSRDGEYYDESKFLVGFQGVGTKTRASRLEDIVCLSCAGTAVLKCPNDLCRNGKITWTEPGKLVPVGDGYVMGPATSHSKTCPTCSGNGQKTCWSCLRGSQESK